MDYDTGFLDGLEAPEPTVPLDLLHTIDDRRTNYFGRRPTAVPDKREQFKDRIGVGDLLDPNDAFTIVPRTAKAGGDTMKRKPRSRGARPIGPR